MRKLTWIVLLLLGLALTQVGSANWPHCCKWDLKFRCIEMCM